MRLFAVPPCEMTMPGIATQGQPLLNTLFSPAQHAGLSPFFEHGIALMYVPSEHEPPFSMVAFSTEPVESPVSSCEAALDDEMRKSVTAARAVALSTTAPNRAQPPRMAVPRRALSTQRVLLFTCGILARPNVMKLLWLAVWRIAAGG
jgi:hypothetical protein